jgi:sugar-specific transcriptional regulator TrmB
MDIQILEQIGLTKTEVKIYLTLLKTGQATTTKIVREARIHASKVYEFLDRLIQKGLVTYVIKSNKKHFTAADPEHLKEFLKEKQRRIQDQEEIIDQLIPSLVSIQKEKADEISFQVYEGMRGIKSFYERLLQVLNKGETSHLLGAPKIGNEKLEGYLLDWHARRVKKGVKLKAIYDSDNKKYGEVRSKMKYSKVKYLPKYIASPMWIEISKDYVAIGHIKGNNAVLFAIKDAAVAKGYLDYFKLIWSVSTD